jgi:hypothetical protein
MISQDLAMRVVIENAELLIYTSRILPMDCWSEALKSFICGKALFFLLSFFFPPLTIGLIFLFLNWLAGFQSKFYLWGVFRPKKPSAPDVVPGEQQGLTKAITWERRSPVSPLSNGSYGSGLMCPSQDS